MFCTQNLVQTSFALRLFCVGRGKIEKSVANYLRFETNTNCDVCTLYKSRGASALVLETREDTWCGFSLASVLYMRYATYTKQQREVGSPVFSF